jgi:uncharacterized BrkB/YihY/UPF0761 family membrane protein
LTRGSEPAFPKLGWQRRGASIHDCFYSATYGSRGAVIVLMLWLYLMGAVILIGGEINAEIARAADHPVVQKEGSDRSRSA